MNIERLRNFAANIAATTVLSFLITVGGTIYQSYEVSQLKTAINESNEARDSSEISLSEDIRSLKYEQAEMLSKDIYLFSKIKDLELRLNVADGLELEEVKEDDTLVLNP